MYLSRCDRANDWKAVVVFKSRSLDPGNLPQFVELLSSQRVRRIYLGELGEVSGQSIGVGIVKLVVETKKKAANLARNLLNRANKELVDQSLKQQVMGLIETIILYKLSELTPKELEAMFGLDELKKTWYFQDITQEARQEGKQETIPNLLKLGLSIEQIAGALNLPVEQFKQIAARSPN